jgi:hypothetical protein
VRAPTTSTDMPISVRRAALVAACALLLAPVAGRAQSAQSLLDSAIVRMGGATALREVKRARFDLITQWQRLTFDGRPYGDQPSYESHTDLRDYDARAWRNTRRFLGSGATGEIVDVVLDTVAIRRSLGGPGGVASPAVAARGAWTTLNVAYVDERRALFALAPERLLLAARDARDLRLITDTTIAGAPYARVVATIDGIRRTILLRRSTGFLGAVRFRGAEPNDFGLVPYGEMEVELWYSAWRKQPGGIVYPFQWDVRRAGRPYKRMTVIAATFNPPATPDSFVVSDSLHTAYLATSTRPMHEIALDSARVVEPGFVSFNTPGAPSGAVKIGARWLLLETGQAPSSAERARSWLAAHDSRAEVAGALVTMPGQGMGGASSMVGKRVPLYVGDGALPFVAAALDGYATPRAAVTAVTAGRWLRIGGDSLRLEPIDLPDAPGTLVAYAPSLKWLYSAAAANPLYLDRLLAHARARGWRVSRIGSARGALSPSLAASR